MLEIKVNQRSYKLDDVRRIKQNSMQKNRQLTTALNKFKRGKEQISALKPNWQTTLFRTDFIHFF